MNEGEMIGIQGYHLQYLGLASPSLVQGNPSLPTAVSRDTAVCCPACAKAMQAGDIASVPQQNRAATGIKYHHIVLVHMGFISTSRQLLLQAKEVSGC